MKNGRADHDDDEPRDPKIASIEEARRRRQLGLGQNEKSVRRALPKGGGVKEFVVGAIIVAMAVGLVVSLTRPLWQGALSLAP
jgi:hypothetical protein